MAGVGWGAEDRHSLTRSTAFCPFSNLHCTSLSTRSSRPANWSSLHPLRPLPLSLQVPRCPSSQTLPCHLALKNSGSPVYLFTPVGPQDPFSLEGSMGTKREFFSFTNSFVFFSCHLQRPEFEFKFFRFISVCMLSRLVMSGSWQPHGL